MKMPALFDTIAHNYAQSAGWFFLWMVVLIFAVVYHDAKEEKKRVGRN